MRCDQARTSLIPPEQKFNFRGLWNPNAGEPLLPSKYDAYIVSECTEEYEVGDWIVRDKDNKRFLHISVGIVSSVLASLDCISRDEFTAVSNAFLKTNQESFEINKDTNEKIDDLSIKVQEYIDSAEEKNGKQDGDINDIIRYIRHLEDRVSLLECK